MNEEEIIAILESEDLEALRELIDSELTTLIQEKMAEYDEEAWNQLMNGNGSDTDMRGILN